MKMLKNALASVALAGLVVAQPVMAASTPPRAASPTGDSEQLEGTALWVLLGIIGILGVLELTGVTHIIDGGDDNPSSP